MNTRTARPARTRVAAAAAVLAGITLSISACGGSSNNPAAEPEKPTVDVYQNTSASREFLVIEDSDISQIRLSSKDMTSLFKEINEGDIDPDADYVKNTGTLTDDASGVIWNDGGDDPIQITDDAVSYDDYTWIDADSDQAKEARDRIS